MYTIKNDISKEIVIDKSKFICYLKRVKSVEEATEEINKIKKTHYNANHHCVAMSINNIVRSTDDGEPQGTAGMPMLGVLTNKNLNEIVAVVVRYFGGVKLGKGGLKRAYSNAVVEALDEATFVEMVVMDELKITLDYHYANLVLNRIDELIENKHYTDTVDIYYLVEPDNTENIIDNIREITNDNFLYEILGNRVHEKEV